MDVTAVADRVGDDDRVLLLAPTLAGGTAGSLCDRLMFDGDRPGLYVSLVRPVEDIVAAWRDGGADAPLAVVSVQSRTASTAATPVRTEIVADPGDLTGLGIAVTECLEALPAAPRVCFDSMTVLLQYVDVERAFRFVHVLSRYLAEANGSLHVHLDPDATDDQAVATLASLFDSVVRHQDGAWAVTR